MPRLPAEITRPALRSVVPRPRRFRRLDQLARKHRVVWVCAPARSGKTTLVASWLLARRRCAAWYNVDAGDVDAATYFYYLREAVQRLARGRREVAPLLTPEYAFGLDAYARNFFHAVGERVPRGTLLVLDNHQELPAASSLHEMLSAGISAHRPSRGTHEDG